MLWRKEPSSTPALWAFSTRSPSLPAGRAGRPRERICPTPTRPGFLRHPIPDRLNQPPLSRAQFPGGFWVAGRPPAFAPTPRSGLV